jgi:uncharacterized protein YdhG (YjbR/CyaY superfamily)
MSSREHSKKRKQATRKAGGRPVARADTLDRESAVLAKIAAMPNPYRKIAERLHVIIGASAPSLVPKVWYGMPGYAQDGAVVCFFRGGQVSKERYMTLGFNNLARLDDGVMWPIAFALTDLTVQAEETVAALVKKAVG